MPAPTGARRKADNELNANIEAGEAINNQLKMLEGLVHPAEPDSKSGQQRCHKLFKCADTLRTLIFNQAVTLGLVDAALIKGEPVVLDFNPAAEASKPPTPPVAHPAPPMKGKHHHGHGNHTICIMAHIISSFVRLLARKACIHTDHACWTYLFIQPCIHPPDYQSP